MNNTYYDFPVNLRESDASVRLTKKLSNNKILSCIIMKDSEVIYEYFQNKKVPQQLQKINSCTKSITSALIGKCLEQGLIPDVQVPITEYFGDQLINDPDPRKNEITLYHLLTMSAGFHWPEFGEWHFFAPMLYSKEILGFILNRELETTPGEHMNYNSGCSHLLGVIIQKVTHTSVEDFAKDVLFCPLGIDEYHWYDHQGQNLTADGLILTTKDMLKIGSLYLNEGIYKKKRILSSDWIHESTKPLYLTYDGIGSYGYQWWSSTLKFSPSENAADSTEQAASTEIPFYFAMGFMGQFIVVIPELNVTAAMTSRLDDTMLPLDIFRAAIGDLLNEPT